MSKINLLDEDLINKIAAGEVIERPASVVKELIENSLDAGATSIEIEIKDSGKELIKITDNGDGMSEEDARKAILRHATSKISSVEDLFSIGTLGFRGEALASIASVSHLSITTKQKEEIAGVNLIIEGGHIASCGLTAAKQGTTIKIHNLFFNTPVRKKFLKTDSVELRHIVDVVIRYALGNPKIFFKLIHEDHVLINSPTVPDHRSNISSIYGISIAKELLEVKYADENVKITGFISKPYQARNDKTQQMIFVNRRWIRNNELSKAIYEAYHSTLFVNKHPIFILEFEINPEKIDVNVHPQKEEIRIDEKDKIHEAVYLAVEKTLEINNLIPILDFKFEQQLTFGTPDKKEMAKVEARYQMEPSQQTVFVSEINNQVSTEDVSTKDISEDYFKNNSEQSQYFLPEQELTEEISTRTKIPPLKILGQVHKTYFIAETNQGLFIIDQHAIHERVLYEQFREQLLNKKIQIQSLLKGEVLELTASEKLVFSEHKDKISSLGFTLEEFGENTILVKSVPTLFGRIQHSEIIYEIISKLLKGEDKLEEIQEEIIVRMACRAAVMAGDELTIGEINKILDDLTLCNKPYTCPHGRPSIIKLSVDELEKKFKRK